MKRLVLDDAAYAELEDAIAHLEDAIAHYEKERAGLGIELSVAVETVFRALADGTIRPVTVPGIPNELGVRRVFVARFPFAIIHIDEPDAVYVVAVAHAKRQALYWQERLGRPPTP